MTYILGALSGAMIIGFVFLLFRFLLPAFNSKANAVSMTSGVIAVLSVPLGLIIAALGWIGKSGAAPATNQAAENFLMFGATSLLVGLVCCAVARFAVS
jgi:hypothetical protein